MFMSKSEIMKRAGAQPNNKNAAKVEGEKLKSVSIQLSGSTLKKCDSQAKKEGLSRAKLLRQIITKKFR